MTRRRRLACATSLLLLAVPPVRAGGADPIITGPAYQAFGSSNGSWMTWYQNSPDHPRSAAAYASPLGDTGSPVRLNAFGTRGFTGGFDPETDTVIYQQASGGRSNILLYNLDTSVRSSLPPRVNTEHWEYQPRISSAFVLFIRVGRHSERLLLWDRAGGSLTELDSATVGEETVFAGVVGERYATWSRCTRRTCLAMVHDTRFDRTWRVPRVGRTSQYAPAIDEADRQIYYVRSGSACGQHVRILRAPLADPASSSLLTTLPDGVDTDWTQYVVPGRSEGQIDLWFGRYRCRTGDNDVYALRDVGRS